MQPVSSIGDVLGSAGEPPIIVWKGKEYKVAYPTLATLDRMEKLIARRAMNELKELQGAIPDDQYMVLSDQIQSLIVARHYRVGGQLWAKMVSGPEGILLYLQSYLQEHQPTISEDDVKHMAADEPKQVQNAIAMVTPHFLALAGARAGRTPEEIQAIIANWLQKAGLAASS